MPSKHFIDDCSSFVDGPRRPWPSRWRYCSGASKGGHYIGTYGGAPMSPPRHPAKAQAPRSLIAVSIRLVQRHARARRRTRATVQKPFQRRGEAIAATRTRIYASPGHAANRQFPLGLGQAPAPVPAAGSAGAPPRGSGPRSCPLHGAATRRSASSHPNSPISTLRPTNYQLSVLNTSPRYQGGPAFAPATPHTAAPQRCRM
jgi:hypothetical protein